MAKELPIIQKTYDLIKWDVPLLNHLPREHRFQLGDRMVAELYNLLESLVLARYQKDKLPLLLHGDTYRLRRKLFDHYVFVKGEEAYSKLLTKEKKMQVYEEE